MIEKYFRFQIHELSKYLYMVNESMIQVKDWHFIVLVPHIR